MNIGLIFDRPSLPRMKTSSQAIRGILWTRCLVYLFARIPGSLGISRLIWIKV